MSADNEPVAAIPLDYHDRGADALWPLARLLAGAVAIQGIGLACTGGWQLAQAAAQGSGWPREGEWQAYLATQLARAVVGACLSVAGGLAFRRSRAGRSALLWLEGGVAVITVAEAVYSFLQNFWTSLGPQGWMFAAKVVVYLPFSLLMPTLMWLLFRRPEVRRQYTDEMA